MELASDVEGLRRWRYWAPDLLKLLDLDSGTLLFKRRLVLSGLGLGQAVRDKRRSSIGEIAWPS